MVQCYRSLLIHKVGASLQASAYRKSKSDMGTIGNADGQKLHSGDAPESQKNQLSHDLRWDNVTLSTLD